jgi:predicted RNase H-like nuclease (RuvC/YqgF family)
MSEPDAFKISEAVIDLWRCYTIERDMAKELEAENARLKAEVERLGIENAHLHKGIYSLSLNVVQLKDEVERLTLENSQYEEHHKYGQNVITSLREDVERLTKAGDYLACHISFLSGNRHFDASDEWLRAKKGFPSIQEQWKIEERNRAADEAAKEGKPQS